ncbi:MAG: amidohydrolase [Desulfobacterales bacterium]|nr:amidohydrolase [Desulfobacterales bacterium]
MKQVQLSAPADLVLKNGIVYTVDAFRTIASAVAVKDKRVVRVGNSEDVQPLIGDNTQVIDLKGQMVLPAFIDSHMHPAMSGEMILFNVDLTDSYSHEDNIKKIKLFADNHPETTAIRGAGFSRSDYDEIGPRKEWLDEIDSKRPIALRSVDLHSLWVNSRALEMAGITKDTSNPENGVIMKDPDTGEPTGLLQEPGAMAFVDNLMPKVSKQQYKDTLIRLQEWFNSLGMTTSFDAWVEMGLPNYYEAYQELAEAGLLTVRYRGAWYMDPADDYQAQIEKGRELSKRFKTDHWQIHAFKFFADQIIEEETGLLLEPYSHRQNHYGLKVWDDEILRQAFALVDKAGFQIHVHQIGDGAARYVLDALGKVQKENGKRDARHSFAHIQLILPEDIRRMAMLGVNAIIAPYWAVAEDYYWELDLPYLGEERVNRMFPVQSLFDAGLNVAIHSDYGVTEPDFMWAFYSGIKRCLPKRIFKKMYGDMPDYKRITDPTVRLSDKKQIGVLPSKEQMATLEEMIEAATINGAKANFLEKNLGSIEVGKLADLVVLDRNLFAVNVENIPEAKVVITFFEGKMVYSAEGAHAHL